MQRSNEDQLSRLSELQTRNSKLENDLKKETQDN